MAESSHHEILFKKNPLPMWVFDLETLAFLDVNQAAILKYGYSRDEFLRMSLKDIRPSEDIPALLKRVRVRSNELKEDGEWRHLKKDGTLIDVEITSHDVEWEGRQAMLVVANDITERKREREALMEEHNLLRTLIDNMPDLIYVKDAESRFVVANPAVARLMGRGSAEELLGKTDLDFFPKELAAAYFSDEQAIIQSRQALVKQEEASVDAKGDSKWLSTSKVPLRDKNGQVIGIIGIGRDITVRKQAEAQLRLQTTALESAANAVVISDPSGNILWVNPAFTVMTGYSAEEIVGRTFSILNSGKHPKSYFEQMWKTILSGKVWHGEIINRRKDGSLFTDEQTITPVRGENGEIIRYVTIEQDVSEKKQLARQLSQSQKMESIGRLAGGVAHDFNNLLTVVLSYSDALLDRADLDPQVHKQVEEIKKAGVRAASLTRQLLAFSRQQVLEPKILNLNAIVTDTEKMLLRLIGEDVELLTRLDPNLASVKVDPGQIEQIVMNLVVNARDAMPKGGRVIVETSNADLDEGYARLHPPSTPGRYILLTVTDTGTGMDQETKGHIFEPFFTTKELGKGSGLGLSTVYGIVKQSGGYIWVYSEPKQGSVFKIYLPRVDGPAEQVRPSEPATEHLRGSETIVVVEDEESLRTLTCGLLQQSGYTVLEAKSGPQAVELARTHSGPIHLLMTDLVMPEMSGSKVAEEITQMRPQTKVVFMSGYTRFSATDSGLVDLKVTLLQKPFSRAALLHKVREALDAQPETKPR